MGKVDSVDYVDGERVFGAIPIHQTYDVARERSGLTWIALNQPSRNELASVAAEFDLHSVAVETTVNALQASKIERYGKTPFVVLETADYLDEPEVIELGELHMFAGPNFEVTVRHNGIPDMGSVPHRIEHDADCLTRGSEAILWRT